MFQKRGVGTCRKHYGKCLLFLNEKQHPGGGREGGGGHLK